MKNKVDLLCLQRIYSWKKEGWFVPLSTSLEGISPSDAAWQPAPGENTIWQLVNHLNYWNDLMLSNLQGNPRESKLSNDHTFGQPGDPKEVTDWEATVERSRRIELSIHKTLNSLDDNDLEELSLSDEVAQWIMHDSYHIGQIVLIRKLQGSWPANR
ncbi:DinB family protein [Virgibacillus flavescens]|uniref:DinB family protein n=1 Tax=Virgibacillus flavescens TaxID=1611422 RepID=UPI003D32777A